MWVVYFTNDYAPLVNTDKDGDKYEFNYYALESDTGDVANLGGRPSIDDCKVIGADVSGSFWNLGTGGYILKPKQTGIVRSNPIHFTTYKDYLSTMNVLGTVYKNVYVNETKFISCLGCTDTAIVRTYYSSESGMVKFVSTGSKTFTMEMVRNHIIR